MWAQQKNEDERVSKCEDILIEIIQSEKKNRGKIER